MTTTTETFDNDLIARLLCKLSEQPPNLPELDRLLDMRAMVDLTGWSRTTLLRNEGLGLMPRRRKLPNGHTAWLASEIMGWLERLPLAPLPGAERRAAARFCAH